MPNDVPKPPCAPRSVEMQLAFALILGIAVVPMSLVRAFMVRPALKSARPLHFLSGLFSHQEVDPGQVEGTSLRILRYPHPSLRAENEIVTEFDASLKRLSREMFKVMYAAQGVGLAAPQVGVNKRLMVYNPEGNERKWTSEVVLVNPQIVARSEGTDKENEGCLSFPDMDGEVERNKWIKVEAQSLQGKKIKRKFQGWEARIFQHEYDHLDGIVYPDRLAKNERERVQGRLDELIAEFGEGGAL